MVKKEIDLQSKIDILVTASLSNQEEVLNLALQITNSKPCPKCWFIWYKCKCKCKEDN